MPWLAVLGAGAGWGVVAGPRWLALPAVVCYAVTLFKARQHYGSYGFLNRRDKVVVIGALALAVAAATVTASAP
ncbi:hypothetical protein SSPIM334S_00259 [Streptomyces spiroverticillatus]